MAFPWSSYPLTISGNMPAIWFVIWWYLENSSDVKETLLPKLSTPLLKSANSDFNSSTVALLDARVSLVDSQEPRSSSDLRFCSSRLLVYSSKAPLIRVTAATAPKAASLNLDIACVPACIGPIKFSFDCLIVLGNIKNVLPIFRKDFPRLATVPANLPLENNVVNPVIASKAV